MLHYIKSIFSFRHHHLSETRQLIYEAAVLELLIVSILSITAKIIHIISHFHTEYVGLWMDYNSKVLKRSCQYYSWFCSWCSEHEPALNLLTITSISRAGLLLTAIVQGQCRLSFRGS